MAAPVEQVGLLSSEAGEVPIFSMDAVDLTRSQKWNIESLGPSSVYLAMWEGCAPVYYDINFDILVGWGSIRSRTNLRDCVRAYHAMASHRIGPNKKTLPPPPVRLLIAGYVNMTGVMADVRTSAQPPWGDGLMPTKCTFTGRFCFLPGYDASGISFITKNNEDMSMEKVKGSLYFA